MVLKYMQIKWKIFIFYNNTSYVRARYDYK